jgi:hypothetical protein
VAKKRETRRQERIQNALRKRYGRNIWLFKVHGGPFQKDGIGDLMGVVHGLGFMFEVKEPDGEESELQKETLSDFRAAGGIAAFIEEPEEAIRRIDRALARAGRG